MNRLSDQHFVMPYPVTPYEAPLADWDPRCIECGRWPTDCECASLPETDEEETH